MSTTAGERLEAAPAAGQTTADGAWGWYLYGITRPGLPAPALVEADAGLEVDAGAADAAPLELLELSGLAAVVRPVLLADYAPAVLRERLQDASALEALVRSHNRVLEAVHRRQAILPAKFGSVYARPEDVLSALGPAHDGLLRQLERLEGCDEWAVHLYAERARVRERLSAADPAIRRLREQGAAARPGRAYFLERQLQDELAAVTEQALELMAETVYDRLASAAVAAQPTPVGTASDEAGEVEILRAAFLVARAGAERFEAELGDASDADAGLRCEHSGPWPPYSFAAGGEGAPA